jgi:hypothetical protein
MFGKEKNNFLFLPGKLFQRNQRGLTAPGCLGRRWHGSKCKPTRTGQTEKRNEIADAINYVKDNA